MKHLDEYRDGDRAKRLVEAIKKTVTRPHVLMEVCGGQTHTIVKYGLDELLPAEVELVHGPGCPVCVTALETLDRAHAIAAAPNVIFATYGDMLRVPGSNGDLFTRRAAGADVRVVYSPLDALKLAVKNPERQVVFFGIGFETTAPANAMAVAEAERKGLTNFSALVSHVLVPPAMSFLLDMPDNRVQGFLGPGHVCTVMGTREYEPIAARHHVPIVVTGFEPVDLLEGILRAVRQLEAKKAEVEVQYARVVRPEGNPAARALIERVFEVCDRSFRGIGEIPASGLRLREAFKALDAEQRFAVSTITPREPAECIAGEVLKGVKKPGECPAFGNRCTPDTPLGATMVSGEGACAAYFSYARTRNPKSLPLADATSRG